MGPDSRFGSFGLCFGPNGRFSTHLGPYLIFGRFGRYWPIWPDGPRRALTEDSMDPNRCTTEIRTNMGPQQAPTSPDGTQWDPTLCQQVTVSDNVRHGTTEPDHVPPLARAPRDEITACGQALTPTCETSVSICHQ